MCKAKQKKMNESPMLFVGFFSTFLSFVFEVIAAESILGFFSPFLLPHFSKRIRPIFFLSTLAPLFFFFFFFFFYNKT